MYTAHVVLVLGSAPLYRLAPLLPYMPAGTGQGLNPELVSIFRRLAELAKSDPKPFKRIAMSKVRGGGQGAGSR
jgi:hypothetical protein